MSTLTSPEIKTSILLGISESHESRHGALGYKMHPQLLNIIVSSLLTENYFKILGYKMQRQLLDFF